MSFSAPPTPALPTVPQAPAPPPAFGQAQTPKAKPKSTAVQPTFLGGSPANTGQKTLLGQ